MTEKMFIYIKEGSPITSEQKKKYANSIVFDENTGTIWTHEKEFGSVEEALAELTYFSTVSGNSGSASAGGPNQTLNIKGDGTTIQTAVSTNGVTISYIGETTDTVTTVASADKSITVVDNGSGTTHTYDIKTDGSLVKLGSAVTAAEADGTLDATDTINSAFAKVLKKIASINIPDVPVQSVSKGSDAIDVTPTTGDVKVSLKTDNSGNVQFSQTTTGLKGTVDLSDYALSSDIPDVPVKDVTSGSNGITVNPTTGNVKVALNIAQTQGSNVTVTQENGLKVEVDLSNYWNKTEMPKDLVVSSGKLSEDGQTLELTLSSGDKVNIDVSKLIDTYNGGKGINIEDHVVHVELASDNEEKFLTVDAKGLKLSGVETAINTAKNEVLAKTVNGKALSTNPELNGDDIELTGYVKGSSTEAVAATDTVNEAIAKLENRIVAAAAGGVTSFGGETGDITVKSGSTTSGEVNFAMSGKQLTGTVYGVATAAQGEKADSAVQDVSVTNGTYVTASVSGTTTKTITINDSAIESLFAWEEL